MIVDDHAMFRTGVQAELGRDARSRCVGEAADVDEAVAAVDRARGPTSCCSTCTCPAAAAPR